MNEPSALKGIPKGAKIVGEFHTHPAGGITRTAWPSGEDMQRIWGGKNAAETGRLTHGFPSDSQYHGYIWKPGDTAILRYNYLGKAGKTWDPENVSYSWVSFQ